MKISTTKEKLLKAVLFAERITTKKESLTLLSCVLIEVGKTVSIRATNLESGIDIQVPSDIEEEGIIAVSATVLSQTIRSINADIITLKTDGSNLIIESRGTKTLIKSIPHEEFPTIFGDNVDLVKKQKIIRNHFLHGLQSVSYATSTSMIRPELGSVYISLKDGVLTAVATDSFRLAEKVIYNSSKDGDGDLLVPLKHVNELIYIIERMEVENIELQFNESELIVSGGGVHFVSRVVDTTFPNYKEIIPKKFTTEATLLKNDFIEMLRKARVFAGNEQNIGLHIYPKRKIFSATARSADVGEMSDTIDAAISGEDLDINFHITYLADCLPLIESDSITIGFAGVGRAAVVHGVSDTNFTYLVMPLNR